MKRLAFLGGLYIAALLIFAGAYGFIPAQVAAEASVLWPQLGGIEVLS